MFVLILHWTNKVSICRNALYTTHLRLSVRSNRWREKIKCRIERCQNVVELKLNHLFLLVFVTPRQVCICATCSGPPLVSGNLYKISFIALFQTESLRYWVGIMFPWLNGYFVFMYQIQYLLIIERKTSHFIKYNNKIVGKIIIESIN